MMIMMMMMVVVLLCAASDLAYSTEPKKCQRLVVLGWGLCLQWSPGT